MQCVVFGMLGSWVENGPSLISAPVTLPHGSVTYFLGLPYFESSDQTLLQLHLQPGT